MVDEATWLAAQQASLATAVDAMNTATMEPGTSSDEVREFVYGSYVDEVVCFVTGTGAQAKRYYPHYNHLYSVAALTGDPVNGVVPVVERYKYDAYGKQTITAGVGGAVRAKSAVGFDRGFTGYIADNETGLLHARARQYSPTLGRFVGRDSEGYIDGYSLYFPFAFPNGLDPSGNMALGGPPVCGFNSITSTLDAYRWRVGSTKQPAPPAKNPALMNQLADTVWREVADASVCPSNCPERRIHSMHLYVNANATGGGEAADYMKPIYYGGHWPFGSGGGFWYSYRYYYASATWAFWCECKK